MKTVLTLLILAQLTACMSFSDGSFSSTRDSLSEQMPHVTLEKEFAISFGSGLLNFLNVVALDESDISDLEHVQVAVYNVDSGGRYVDFNNIDFSETLRSRGASLHWETIVKVRDENEQVWVLVGMNIERNSLDAVSVFVLDQDELVMINVDGDLDRMIEFALRPASERRLERKAG